MSATISALLKSTPRCTFLFILNAEKLFSLSIFAIKFKNRLHSL